MDRTKRTAAWKEVARSWRDYGLVCMGAITKIGELTHRWSKENEVGVHQLPDIIERMAKRICELEGVIARANAAVRDMDEQAAITSVPIEWERRLDDLDAALKGAHSVTRGDEQWEAAEAVIEAARRWHKAEHSSQEESDALCALFDAVEAYDAKKAGR